MDYFNVLDVISSRLYLQNYLLIIKVCFLNSINKTLDEKNLYHNRLPFFLPL